MNLTAYILRLLQDFEIMGKAGKIVRLVRVMRIMRIFKLVRHFAGPQSLIYTLNQVRRPRQRFSKMYSCFGALCSAIYICLNSSFMLMISDILLVRRSSTPLLRSSFLRQILLGLPASLLLASSSLSAFMILLISASDPNSVGPSSKKAAGFPLLAV